MTHQSSFLNIAWYWCRLPCLLLCTILVLITPLNCTYKCLGNNPISQDNDFWGLISHSLRIFSHKMTSRFSNFAYTKTIIGVTLTIIGNCSGKNPTIWMFLPTFASNKRSGTWFLSVHRVSTPVFFKQFSGMFSDSTTAIILAHVSRIVEYVKDKSFWQLYEI